MVIFPFLPRRVLRMGPSTLQVSRSPGGPAQPSAWGKAWRRKFVEV